MALYYLIKIKAHVPSHDFTKEQPRDQSCMRAMQCGRRMFLAALILASKYLQDRNYSARAWSKISGLNTLEINQNELMFLEAVEWRLHICEATFQRWTDLVLKLTPGAGGLPASEGQSWRTVLHRLTPDLESFEFEPMTPVSMGSMDLGLADSPSPRSMPSMESIRSTSREQTPTCPRSLPRAMEPTPRMEYARLPMPTMLRPQVLPTPQMTPKSHVAGTPAASATACGPRRPSICTAMSQAQNLGMARSTLDQRPPLSFCPRAPSYDGYPAAVRRSSLARSTSSASSASSPDSMVSDVSTLSSRSSRSSSVSSSASATGAPSSRLAVMATLRCTNNSLKEGRKTLSIASPIDETSLANLYSSSDYPGALGSAPDLSTFTLDSSLSEAARSLCELSGATPERRQCRKRGRTGSDDLLLQNHVRHLIDAGASGVPPSVFTDAQLATSFLVSGGSSLSGPAGMKRACCGSEARKIALNPSIRAELR